MSNSNTACVLGIVLSFLCTARIATAADIPGQYRGLQQSKMAKLINVWGDPRPLHSHTVTGVAISPDGKIAFTSGSMPDLAFWDIRDGSELRMFKSQFGYGSAKGFSPDGKVAVSTAGPRLQLWDVESGTLLKTLSTDLHLALSFAYSPDGKSIFVGGRGGTGELWETQSGKKIWSGELCDAKTAKGHRAPIHSVSFTADGERVVTACGNKLVVWSVDTTTVLETFVESGSHSRFLTSNSDGTLAASLQWANVKEPTKLQLWNVAQGKVVRNFDMQDGHVRLRSVRFTPDGKRLVGWTQNGLHVWDVESGGFKRFLIAGAPGAPVSRIAISPDSRSVLIGTAQSGGSPMQIQLLDLATGNDLWEFTGHNGRVSALAFTPDGNTVLSGGGDGVVRVWDTSTGKQQSSIEQAGRTHSIAISPDGQQAFVGATIKASLFDIETGKRGRQFNVLSATVGYCRNGEFGIMTQKGSNSGGLRVVDLDSGKVIRRLQDPGRNIKFAAFSDDGAYAACVEYTAARDLKTMEDQWVVELWDIANNSKVVTLSKDASRVSSVLFSPDGSILVCAKARESIELWDVKTATKRHDLRSKKRPPLPIAISPDNEILLAIGDDSVELWSVSEGRMVDRLQFPKYIDNATCGRFSPDGKTFIIGTGQGPILHFQLLGQGE